MSDILTAFVADPLPMLFLLGSLAMLAGFVYLILSPSDLDRPRDAGDGAEDPVPAPRDLTATPGSVGQAPVDPPPVRPSRGRRAA